MQTITGNAHIVRDYKQQKENEIIFKKILSQIENSRLNPYCISSPVPNSQLKPNLICSGNLLHFQYYYVVETLGVNNCWVIAKNSVAEILRTTVYVISPESHKYFLQSIWIRAALPKEQCLSVAIMTQAGRQIWYEIEGNKQ